MRRALKKELVKPVKSLRQACIERGIDPDNTGVTSTKQHFNWVDRIIPGKPDPESPSLWYSRMRPGRSFHARQMYPRNSAANDAALIAQAAREGKQTEAYVARFCQLNNLKEWS